MSEDDVVREVRAAREEYCRQFGYDLRAIVRDLHEQAHAGGRRLVRLAPRRPVQGTEKGASQHAALRVAPGPMKALTE